MTTTLEKVGAAMCFAGCAKDAGDGKLVIERSCGCKSVDECWEIKGSLREEILLHARAAIQALIGDRSEAAHLAAIGYINEQGHELKVGDSISEFAFPLCDAMLQAILDEESETV